MPDRNCGGRQTVHFEQEATRQFTCRWVTRHVAWDVAVEHLTCCVGVFTNLHLEWNVPDVVQTKWYQAALNEAVDTERHNRVLVSRPLREGLDCCTDWWPDERQNHTGENRGQTRNDRHKTFTREEAQILRQLDAIEAVKHIRCNRTGDDTTENTGVRQMLSGNLFSR
ncbi:Uncharacterised protein [Enterobacter cloacae]|nr:Uncharacterised protein [Enterobacter cloacae]